MASELVEVFNLIIETAESVENTGEVVSSVLAGMSESRECLSRPVIVAKVLSLYYVTQFLTLNPPFPPVRNAEKVEEPCI